MDNVNLIEKLAEAEKTIEAWVKLDNERQELHRKHIDNLMIIINEQKTKINNQRAELNRYHSNNTKSECGAQQGCEQISGLRDAIAEAEERALKWADCHYVTCFGDIEKLDTKQRHLTKYWNKYFAAYRASKGESECKMSEKESEHSSVSCSLPAVSVSRSDCGNSQKSLSGSGVTSESSDCRASQQQQPDNSKIVCTSKFSVEDVVAVKDKAPYYQDMAVKRWDGGIVPFTIVGVSPGMQHDQRGYWLEAPGYGKKGDYGNGRIMVDSVDLMPIADVTPKQQPEHQPWCQSVQPSESMSRYCTCERRVHQQRDGKDRRAWLFANMRSVNERRVNFRRATYPNGQTHGRRSGETYADWYEQYKGDRRQG